MAERVPFIIPLHRTATSTSDFVISTHPWEPGYLVYVTGIGLSNADHSNKDVVIGIKRYELDIWVETVTLSTAGDYYIYDTLLVFPSDYRVIVKCESPNSGDRYTANIIGYLEKPVLKD